MSTRQLLNIEVRTEQDVVFARQRARQLANLLGFDLQGQTKLGTAVSEIVRNAYRYAGGGKVTFIFEDEPNRRLVIRVSDHGQGIANLQEILEGRYDSKTGMGMGLMGTRRIMDRFEIASAPGQGTTVTMSKFLSPRASAITGDVIARIAGVLAQGLPGDPLGEIQLQNQELLRVLDELQQRQMDLQRLNQELEDTNRGVVALYAELESRSDFLRKASEVKSRFLSNMTHEFRTPLNSILALSNLLITRADGDLTQEQERQVGFIRSSADALSGLVNDLLDIAKVDAGKVAVKATSFEISALFGALKGMLKPLLSASTAVTLTFIEPEAPITLQTDEGKVSQVLRNFISNALKFTERGEVRVFVETPVQDRISICVSDTGIGIKPEDLPGIFEEFGQLDTIAHQRFKGTGLGLPLSKRLAELLGGRVGVTSQPGLGSIFRLDIPLTYSGSADAALVQVPKTPASLAAYKRQALIIDDDDVSRYLLRGLLPSSFEAVEASSGSEGLEAAARLHPDVIFLDLHMPILSGFEVLKRLKEDPATSDVRVIIYSAQNMDGPTLSRLSSADAILSAKGTDPKTARDATLAALGKVGLLASSEPGRG